LRRFRSARWRRRSRSRGSLLSTDCLQNVTWAGNLRKVDLGFNVRLALRARRPGPRRATLGFTADVGSHPLRFFDANRAGMRLFLRHSHHGQHVQNRPALYFQFSGQIVDSNLLHSRFPSPPSR
jgi:hypothetical protein